MNQKNIFMRWLDKRRPLSLLFLLALFMSSSLEVMADDARLTTRTESQYSSFTVSKSKGFIEFYLYMGEDNLDNNGAYSFWNSNPEICVDGKTICTLKDIGLPVMNENGITTGAQLINTLSNIRGQNGIQGKWYNNHWYYVYSHDPRYDSKYKEYWITIGIHVGWNMAGGNHKIEVKGEWCNNGNCYQTSKSYEMNSNDVTTFPDKIGTFKRKNKAITYEQSSGFTAEDDWRYAVAMYNSADRVGYTDNTNSKNYGYVDLPVKGTSIETDFSADNFHSYTYYPRIYNYKGSSMKWWGYSNDNKIESNITFYKDYGSVTFSGYPRAKNVTVETLDAYTKKVKISWSKEISDKDHVDENGTWYVFRKKVGNNSSQEIIAKDLSYTTSSFIDDTDKEYYDESVNEKTQYIYTVCFVPNGWTVNTDKDAEGLSDSITYQLNRTFAFSNVHTVCDSTKIRLVWNHTKITDASGSKTYVLQVQRSTDEKTWTKLGNDINITNPQTEGDSIEDKQGLKPHQAYYYRLSMHVQEKDYLSEDISGNLLGGTNVLAFTASRGTYSSVVKLQWTVKQVGSDATHFTLQRRPLGSSDESAYVTVYAISGTESLYSYEDQTAAPGSYYQYRLLYKDDLQTGQSYKSTDGFGMSTGVVSGRVYYNSGTAVEGVKISLSPNNTDGKAISQFRSLKLNGEAKSGIEYKASNADLHNCFDKDFTIQMYLNPDSLKMGTEETRYLLFDAENTFSIHLIKLKSGNYGIAPKIGRTTYFCSFNIAGGEWTHLSFVYTASDKVITIYRKSGDKSESYKRKLASISVPNGAKCLAFGNYAELGCGTPYSGYVDEFRLFNRALSESEISKNYNHTLAGTEDGLAIYWPMDENLGCQTIAYDYSKTNSVANGRVGKMTVAATSSEIVPSADQLSLSAYTDADGNYMVRGIPFSGGGTNYVITPTLGVHSFNPSTSSRFFSLNSLVHSGVDFKDISSFPVSGKVRYSNTTIPVEGAYIYVDGLLASKDGNPVITASDGTYTVDVPIGDHFITVKKTGHTFDGSGRYPTDSLNVGTKHTFESAVSNLDFFDNTTVVVAGRVAGGDVEYAKPLGLGKGNANIGKAVITLDFKDDPDKAIYIHAKRETTGNSYQYVQDASKRTFETVNGLGKADVAENKNVITIETDSLTGEFAVKLPPLKYHSKDISIPNQTDIHFTNSDIDATNVMLEYTDSVKNTNNGYDRFKYNASLKKEYRSTSILDILEHQDGSYGIDKYTVTDINGKKEDVPIYTIDKNDSVIYNFGYPIYEQLGQYTYNVHAYEKYVSMDYKNGNGDYNVDEVPLGKIDVTISNQLASTTSVKASDGTVGTVTDDTFTLDSLGRAQYTFVAGLPNIQTPYTRVMTASYEVDGTQLSWNNKIEAVILGALSTGNNFTTKGPDEVLMVLRDPPGSQSQTVYEKGTEIVKTKSVTGAAHSESAATATIFAGLSDATAKGAPGFMVIQDIESKATITAGVELNASYSHNNTTTETITTTEDIATSDEPDRKS